MTSNVMYGLVDPERYSNMPTADWYRVASNSSESSVAFSSFVPVTTSVAADLYCSFLDQISLTQSEHRMVG